MGITSCAVREGAGLCEKSENLSKLKVFNLATFNLRRVNAENGEKKGTCMKLCDGDTSD